MDNVILDIKNITKTYNNTIALNNFSLSLFKGEAMGLLGPNGAGKTTLISILSGTLKDFSGSVSFMGKDLFYNTDLKKHIGIVPQDMAFYDDISAMDNLMFWGGLYNIPQRTLRQKCLDMLHLVGLSARAKEPVKNFSGGMKRRLNIAIGMVHGPGLLLLDEPTVGIDVQSKVNILEIIKNAASIGSSIIFTTHQLSEVEQICSRIAIMDKGSVLAQGSLNELIKIVGEKEIVDIEGDFGQDAMSKILKTARLEGFDILSVQDDLVNLSFETTENIPPVMNELFKNNIHISNIKIKSPNLEAVFLKLTGRKLTD